MAELQFGAAFIKKDALEAPELGKTVSYRVRAIPGVVSPRRNTLGRKALWALPATSCR